MLKLPDDEFVMIELVHDPSADREPRGTGVSHIVIKVQSMEAKTRDIVVRERVPFADVVDGVPPSTKLTLWNVKVAPTRRPARARRARNDGLRSQGS